MSTSPLRDDWSGAVRWGMVYSLSKIGLWVFDAVYNFISLVIAAAYLRDVEVSSQDLKRMRSGYTLLLLSFISHPSFTSYLLLQETKQASIVFTPSLLFILVPCYLAEEIGDLETTFGIHIGTPCWGGWRRSILLSHSAPQHLGVSAFGSQHLPNMHQEQATKSPSILTAPGKQNTTLFTYPHLASETYCSHYHITYLNQQLQ